MAELIAALDAAGWGAGVFFLAVLLVLGIVSIVDAVCGGTRERARARRAAADRDAQRAITERELAQGKDR